MTIKEIAAKAGVSIATVSHVINHTRYVSPELVDKIEAIIEESGYSEKIKKKVRKIRSGRSSQIVAVFPNIKSALYCSGYGWRRKVPAHIRQSCPVWRGCLFFLPETAHFRVRSQKNRK